MAIYKVGFWYTVYCTATHVEAESAEAAEQWLHDELEQKGMDEVSHEINDRDYGAQDAEEVTG